MLSLLILPSVNTAAFVQYVAVDGQTGLDNYLQLAQDRVSIANDNPKAGSGTPIFAADGVLGTLILFNEIFGGIASTFFMDLQGKYASIGRG